ncbi:MAG: uroporphyrinogen decarboxylase family protein [Verrucomicrobiota bacterium]
MRDSKQRVLDAVNHRAYDRMPVDFWSTAETDAKLFKHLGLTNRSQLLDEFDVDIVFIEGPEYTGPALKQYPDGSDNDIWGVRRKTCFTGEGDKRQSYKTVVDSPLKEAKDVDGILGYAHWPSPDDYDYSVIRQQCIDAGDRAVFFMGDRLNRIAQLKPAMYLRGMEQILMDAALDPDIFMAIVGKISGFYNEYLERILAAADGMIDVVVTGDDFGTQDGLMVSRQMWRDLLLPGFRKFIEISHSFNTPVMHHTCGGIHEIIGDMIEAGLDVLNPIQPNTFGMDFANLKSEFGDKICFHGGIGIQTNLPFGSPEDVRAEVKEAMAALGKGTGYIACTAHNIQADVPVENTLALFDAYKEYR